MTPADEVVQWLDDAETDWKSVTTPQGLATGTFVSGDIPGPRILVRYYVKSSNQALVAKAFFGPGTLGPPGHAHGGSIASLLDEAMGAAAWFAGHPAVAAELTVRFRRMLPLGSWCLVTTQVVSMEGRKIVTRAELRSHGELIADGVALFVKIDPERFGLAASDATAHVLGDERNTK